MAKRNDENVCGKDDINGGSTPDESRNDSLLGRQTDRRKLLTMAGSSLLSLGMVGATGHVNAATTIDLGEQGLSDGDLIDPYLMEYFDDDTEVYVPAGTYKWGGNGLGSKANAALIGDGDVVFDSGDGTALWANLVATDGTVSVKNITQRGKVSDEDSRIAVWAQSGAEVVLENVNRPDGAASGGTAIGYFVPKKHAGKAVIRNCTVIGFPNNGVYTSSPQKDGKGAVVIEGGLYANNNVANVRVGSHDSVVRKVTSLYDSGFTVHGPGGDQLGRGIWVRHGGKNISVDDCDVTATRDASNVGVLVGVYPRNKNGNGTVTNTRIWNATGNDPIRINPRVIDQWSGSGSHVTAPGNPTVRSEIDDWVECAGSGCNEPTREKQWVGESGGGDSSSGNSSVAVSTEGVSSAGVTTATLSGNLTDLGGASSADVYVNFREAGSSSWKGSYRETVSSTGSYSIDVIELSPGTEYEFRAAVEASDGDTDTGSTAAFETFDHHLVVETADDSGILYSYTTSGAVVGGEKAEIGNNDSITKNDDGTYTVDGETGNGYADDWYFKGDVFDWSAEQHPDAINDDYELRLDGTVVTPDEPTADTDPQVVTDSPTSVTESEATLHGTLEDLGRASLADVSFQYREPGASSWNATAAETLSSTGTFQRTVDGLSTDTEYEYRAVASASNGDVDTGTAVAFTTSSSRSSGPSIDSYEVNESGSPNPHADITAEWSVSDSDGDLSWVLVQVIDSDGYVVDASKSNVSGSSVADVDYFKIKNVDGQTFDVQVMVEDATSNSASATKSVTE